MKKFCKELLRICLQLVYYAPSLFPQNFTDGIKIRWNEMQKNEITTRKEKPRSSVSEHGITPLDLSCITGFGETVHPDVLFIPEGFGFGGWRYVMTITPFPTGVEYFENPEFLVSMDGVSWDIPQGGSSPLVPPPSNWVGYNSDPSLFYENGVLYLFYREVRLVSNVKTMVRMLSLQTADGINWTSPKEFMKDLRHYKDIAVMMSPTVLRRAERYIMWYIDSENDDFCVRRSESKNMLEWSNPQSVSLCGLGYGIAPWHVDVVEGLDSELIMALCCLNKATPQTKKSIVFLFSSDEGFSWQRRGVEFCPDEFDFSSRSLYRASLLRNEDGDWLMYFSGQDFAFHWFTALRRVDIYSS